LSVKNGLPEICGKCRGMKVMELMQEFRDRERYNKKFYICHACLQKPAVKRWGRYEHPETPCEKVAREALEFLVKEGWFIVAEFTLEKKFIYDFSIPKLRMLIEIDSHSYHQFAKQIKRDKRKTAWAKEHGWHLVRFKPSESMGGDIIKAVFQRASEMGY